MARFIDIQVIFWNTEKFRGNGYLKFWNFNSEEYFIEIISSFNGKESSLEVYENLVQVLSAKVAVKRSFYRLENIWF